MGCAGAALPVRERRLLKTRAAFSRRSREIKDLAYALWSFASFQKVEENLDSLLNEVLLKACEFQPKELANTAWAIAKLAIRESDLLGALGR